MAIPYVPSTKLYVILTLLTIHLCNGLAISQSLNTIVIDPGHGGKDHGCTGDHSIEKHLTLDIAYKLKKVVEDQLPHLNVHMTRTHDVFIPLEERCAYANKVSADLFVSIHCNQIDIKSVNGTETYVLGENDDHDTNSTLLREQSNYRVDNHNDYDGNLDYILAQSKQHHNLNESILLASLVMDAMANTTELKQRTIKQANFRVLKGLYMPGVLVETGFISNDKDEQYLRSNIGQYAVANALTKAISQYSNDQSQVHSSMTACQSTTVTRPSTTLSNQPTSKHPVRALPITPSVNYGILIAQTVNSKANTNRLEWTQLDKYNIYQDDQDFHYIVGDYSLKSSALKKLVELQELGFKGARVIPLDLINNYVKLN